MKKRPNIDIYNYDKKVVNYAFDNHVFGGSVLMPIGSKHGERTKQNPLEDQIKSMEINSIKGGGIYNLNSVITCEGFECFPLDDHPSHCDIILITPEVDNNCLRLLENRDGFQLEFE